MNMKKVKIILILKFVVLKAATSLLNFSQVKFISFIDGKERINLIPNVCGRML